MYGLPKSFDGSFLIGQSLDMVCFNASQIYLHFSGSIILTIESAFSYQKASDKISAAAITLPVKDSDLMQLLGHSVVKASGDKDGTLTLVFDNGDVFKCFDTSKNYESYTIQVGGQTIVV